MATTKINSVEMNINDQVDVWVYNQSYTRLQTLVNVKVDDKGKVVITISGDAEVVHEIAKSK